MNKNLMKLAIKTAKTNHCKDFREYRLGSVAVRKDGAIVKSRNGSSYCSVYSAENFKHFPEIHSEFRSLSKAGMYATEMYVARILKNGKTAMARPCVHCQVLIKNKKVKKVYYTINDTQYGIWFPKEGHDIINNQ
jgi:tRNA(Arg) A34 adenosine deaminase TadA